MKRIAILFLVGAGLALLLPGCQKKPAAVVNEDAIPEKVLNHYMMERVGEHKARGAVVSKTALREAVLQQLISDRLMLQGAREKDITASDAEVDRQVEAVRKRRGEKAVRKILTQGSLSEREYREILGDKLIVGKFIQTLVPDNAVTDEEIRDYYKSSPTPFLQPEQVNVRFIQTSTEEQAEALLKELKEMAEGESGFDKLAEKLLSEKRAIASNYGWTKPGLFRGEIADALKTIKAGKHGGPYKGMDGYYLLRIKERRKKGPKSLDEAGQEIRNILLDQKRQSAVAQWVAERRKTAFIAIH